MCNPTEWRSARAEEGQNVAQELDDLTNHYSSQDSNCILQGHGYQVRYYTKEIQGRVKELGLDVGMDRAPVRVCVETAGYRT